MTWAVACDGEERQLYQGYKERDGRQVIMPRCEWNRLPQGYIQLCFLSTELCRAALMPLVTTARCQESPSQVEELDASFQAQL